MVKDILAQYNVNDVAAWYRRLAKKVITHNERSGSMPLSSQFLLAYLNNRNPRALLKFPAPSYLKSYKKVVEAQAYHRRVFLTKEKARIGRGKQWVGVVPRLKDGRWDGIQRLSMTYESLVEVGGPIAEIARIQYSGNREEQDLFNSLRGFQLRSSVVVSGTGNNKTVTVTFENWSATALDRYDWNYDEFLTVPNPDYGRATANAIRPDLRRITVYHKNAKRLEDAKLAAPFNLEVGPWVVSKIALTTQATVDTTLALP